MTTVETRDSSTMRTKSFSTPSRASSSTMRVPFAPPASPVATTGSASCLRRAGDVDALAPGLHAPLLAAMTLAELEVRDVEGLVEGGVRRDGHEHAGRRIPGATRRPRSARRPRLYSPAVPDAPADALTVGSWLRRSARLIARAQRLLVFPSTVRRDLAADHAPGGVRRRRGRHLHRRRTVRRQVDERLLDGLGGDVDVDALEYALLALALVVVPLSQAWLTGCFIRSLVLGRVVRFPGWPVFARLAVFYTALVPLALGLSALARVDGAAAFVALVGVVALAVPTITADYAIGIDELGIPAAIRASVATVRRSPALALLAFWLVYLSGAIVAVLFDQQIANADDVFPLFLVAAALASGVRAYVADCALITFYLGGRELSPRRASGHADALLRARA